MGLHVFKRVGMGLYYAIVQQMGYTDVPVA